MASINVVALVGNLTTDPESIADGRGCWFSLAVNERIKKNDEWQDYASFFNVVAWGKQAEAIVQYLRKGQRVGVQGSLRQERWTDSKSGDNRSAVKVFAQTVMFPPKSEGGGSSSPPPSDVPADQTGLDAPAPASDDDIPF